MTTQRNLDGEDSGRHRGWYRHPRSTPRLSQRLRFAVRFGLRKLTLVTRAALERRDTSRHLHSDQAHPDTVARFKAMHASGTLASYCTARLLAALRRRG